jgi:hypothetical protein
MPSPLFLHQLDEAVDRGCQTPHCPHEHSGELFLTPVCHPGAGVRIEAVDDLHGLPGGAVVGLRCWKCQRPVVQVALATRPEFTPAYQHGSALDVLYSAGNLTVNCRRCHAVQGTVDVAPYGPV